MRAEKAIPDPFNTPLEKLAFILLLCLALFGSSLIGFFKLLDRFDYYSSVPSRAGPYHRFADLLGSKSSKSLNGEKVDLLILGDSKIWTAVDPDLVEKEFFSLTKRAIKLQMFASNWNGLDLQYVSGIDYLKRNSARLVLSSLPVKAQPLPHEMHNLFWDSFEYSTFMDALPWSDKIQFWASESIGSFRKILSILRPNNLLGVQKRVINFGGIELTGRGARESEKGYESSKFELINQPDPVLSDNSHVAIGGFKGFFTENKNALSPIQKTMLELMLKTTASKKTRFGFLYTPRLSSFNAKEIQSQFISPDLTSQLTLIGIVEQEFFNGLNQEEAKKYYYNKSHLNRNGQIRFSRLFGKILAKEGVL